MAIAPNTASVERANDAFATRTYGPVRIVAALILTVLALTLPSVPEPLIVASLTFTSALCNIAIRWWMSGRLQLTAYGVTDVVIVALAGLLVPEVWPFAVLISVGAIATTSAIHRDVSLFLIATLFALGMLPGIVNGGYDAVPYILLSSAVVVTDQFVRRSISTVSLHDGSTLRAALETSASLVHVSNLTSGRTISVQGPIEAITGYSAHEWISTDHRTLIHPDDLEAFWIETNADALGVTFDRKARLRHKLGHWVWVRDVSVLTREADGELYLRGFTIDISEIEEAHALIREQAETDPLTGLANRSVLMDSMSALRKAGTDFTLMFMDLDRFKLINDTMGHHVGDEVLIEVADRITSVAGTSQLVCRLGGDEFAIVAPSMINKAEVADLADRIHAACCETFHYRDVSLQLDTSIGVVISVDTGDTPGGLMRCADLAMYRAKTANVSHLFFDDEMDETSLEDLRLAASLPTAIRDGELELFFQPRVHLRTGHIVGFEGLIRWRHPDLGILAPDRFLHLMTVSDIEQKFVDHVIAQGIGFAEACSSQGNKVPVAINLSSKSFLDDSLPALVDRRLRHHQVPPEMFIIEITERDIMDKPGLGSSILERWSALGIGISIDDFGTGYSSFARLIDMPITEIKIDRRFVAGSTTNEGDEIIIHTVRDLSRRLGLALVAEGVETAAEAELLIAAGCVEAQGFLFARPLPRDEALAALRTRYTGWPTVDSPAVFSF